MKKLLSIAMAALVAAATAATVFAADVSVLINNKPVEFDVPAQIIESRTMVPLRAIFEALGATVEWDDATKTVKSTRGDVTVELTIGKSEIVKNGEAKALDVPAQIVESRTLVPVRAISEAFECKVDWDDSTKTVLITYEEEEKEIVEVPGAIITNANAEPEAEKYAIYPSSAELTIVEDDRDPSNHVYSLDATVADRASWTYLWYDTDFKAGQTYKVEFDLKVGKTVLDGDIAKASLGVCFRYATESENVKDHGVAPTLILDNSEWNHITVIAAIPSDYVYENTTRFGIYGNPIVVDGYDHNIAIDFMLDNISCVPYDGNLAAGTYINEDLVTADKPQQGSNTPIATSPKDFDYANATGIEYVFENDLLGWGAAGATPAFEGGNLVLTSPENGTDPQIAISDLKIDASEYNAVIVRFKPDAVGKNTNMFFATDENPDFSESKAVYIDIPDLVADEEGFVWVMFDFSGNSAWSGNVSKLRFDPVHAAGGVSVVDKIVVIKK